MTARPLGQHIDTSKCSDVSMSGQPGDEPHEGCARKRLGASRRTAREARGSWWAWEVGCLVQARAEITGRYVKSLRAGVEEGQGADPRVRSAQSLARAGRARRRLVVAARHPPGRSRSEPRSRARKYSYDALKPPAGCGPPAAGSAARFLKESMPLLPGLLEAGGRA